MISDLWFDAADTGINACSTVRFNQGSLLLRSRFCRFYGRWFSSADCYEAKERVIQQKVEELRELHVDYFRDRMDTFRKDLKDEVRRGWEGGGW